MLSNHFANHFHFSFPVLFFLGFSYVPQADLELVIYLPQLQLAQKLYILVAYYVTPVHV
jgi:hypothetical protein